MWNKKDFEGVMLGQFVLNNVSTFSKAEIDQLVLVYRNEFHPNLYRLLDICARRAKLKWKAVQRLLGRGLRRVDGTACFIHKTGIKKI